MLNAHPFGRSTAPFRDIGAKLMTTPRILYCHCAYSQVVPHEVKQQVLEKLCGAGVPFDAVPDLCEMSARRDPKLGELAADGPLRIAACYPRAVKWLFAAAETPLRTEGVEILNMRVEAAEKVAGALLAAAPGAPAEAAVGEEHRR